MEMAILFIIGIRNALLNISTNLMEFYYAQINSVL